MRLIDADELFKDLNEAKIPFSADINSFIISAPTIDAEPVVRCKDCRHREYIAGRMFCSKVYSLRVEENHFCSYGVKKDKEKSRNDL